MNLVDCLSELSKLKRHNGTDASILNRIYDIIEAEKSQLPLLISLIPNQNRATIRALWRYTEEILYSNYSFEEQKEMIYKAFVLSDEKLSTVNLVLGNMKKILNEKDEKIHPEIWKWAKSEIIKSLENNPRDFIQMAYQVKLINQMIARNSTDIEMMNEFRNGLESTLRESIQNSKFQSNIEYMSSVAIVLVNLNREKSNEKIFSSLELSANEITDPVYEIFIVRSILSLRLDSTELNIMLLDRLRTIGIEYRNDLEPTHLCNNIRGLCEALEIMKESVAENPKGRVFWIGLEPLFEALGEHPLDVVRVNIWKMLRMSIEMKLRNLNSYKEELISFIENIKSQKLQKRFTMVKVASLCGALESYRLLEKYYNISKNDKSSELIKDVIRMSTFSTLSPIAAEIISNISRFGDSDLVNNVVDELLDYFFDLCEESRAENVSQEKRVFQDILLPKVLKSNRSLGGAILDRCAPYKRINHIQMAILVNKCENKEYGNSNVPVESFRKTLTNHVIELRISAFSFLIYGKKTATVFSINQLDLTKIAIKANMNLHKPLYRQQFSSVMKIMLQRFDLSWHYCNDESYKKFIIWLIRSCLDELSPGASMPRIQSSLMILNLISKIQNQECSDFIANHLLKTSLGLQLHQTIQEQLRNSFPDINQLAFDILIHLQRLHKSNDEPCILDQKCVTTGNGYVAKMIAELRNSCSIATSNGLSLELLYAIYLESATEKIPNWKLIANTTIEILDMLEEDLEHFNILEACQTTPHFGLMSGVEFMLKYGPDFPKEIQNILVPKIIGLCYKATKYAEPVVNSSSPEGFLPDIKNDFLSNIGTKSDSTEIAKALLVMCWRIMKASATILGSVGDIFDISLKQFRELGTHFTNQLTRARHRGAFELAALGFKNLCIQTKKSDVAEIRCLMETWLEDAFLFFHDQSRMTELCNTRRSAGLPYLFCSIACADSATSRSKDLMKKIISTLLPIGIQNVNPETSCHARNILRALFRESSLGEDSLLWAEDALIISITGFGDESWALRNTSAMLYSTLCSRIFGTKKSAGLEDEEKISSSEFFNRFPKLEQFLLETIETGANEMISNPNKLNPTLLPALLIIQRLIPTGTSQNESHFVKSLLILVQSKVWKCRKVAARCIYAVNSHPESEIINILEKKLLKNHKDHKLGQNSIHGLLLALEQFIATDTTLQSGSLEVTLITELGQLNNASAAIAIGILTKLKLSENSEDNLMSFIRKRIERTFSCRHAEIAEMDLFNSIAEYLILHRAKSMPEILAILSNRKSQQSNGSQEFIGNFNFIRAITIAIDNLISHPKVPLDLKLDFENENFIKAIENIIFCEQLEDETLVAASSVLVKIGRKNLIQKSLHNWKILIQNTMERVNNAEFAGFLLEIAAKFEFDMNLEPWLIKGSSAEQHFCMRMSCSIVTTNMLAKGLITPRLVQAAFMLLGDEDDEVRFPLIDLFGDLAFDENGFCRATSILSTTNFITKTAIELEEYLMVIFEIGFLNKNTQIRLFEMDRNKSLFQLSQLNMNYEPLVMTRLALSSLTELIKKVEYEGLRVISKFLTEKLMELTAIEKKDTVLEQQIILLSNFIANI